MSLPSVLLTQLRQSQRLVVVTGGGMSAESGIASFRQALTGSWANYDVRDLATPQAYARNPKLVWQWYDFRRQMAEQAAPSAAHHALVDLEQHIPEFLLVSLAIDGHFFSIKRYNKGILIARLDHTPWHCFYRNSALILRIGPPPRLLRQLGGLLAHAIPS